MPLLQATRSVLKARQTLFALTSPAYEPNRREKMGEGAAGRGGGGGILLIPFRPPSTHPKILQPDKTDRTEVE